MGWAVGFQALRGPAAPLSRELLGPLLFYSRRASGFGEREQGSSRDLPFPVCVCSRDASDRPPAGLWPRVMHSRRPGEGSCPGLTL